MSTETYDKITRIQQHISELLTETPYLSGIEVLTQLQKDLAQKVQATVTKLGVCIIVFVPEMRLVRREQTRLVFDVKVLVEVSEKPLTNKTGKPALACATAVARALDSQPNGLPDLKLEFSKIEVDSPDAIQLIPDDYDVIYHVHATTKLFI